MFFFSKYEWNDDGRENFPGAVWGHAWLSRGHHHHQLLFLLQISLFTTPLILSSIVLPVGDTTPILSHFFSKWFFLQLRSFPDITILCSFSHSFSSLNISSIIPPLGDIISFFLNKIFVLFFSSNFSSIVPLTLKDIWEYISFCALKVGALKTLRRRYEFTKRI